MAQAPGTVLGTGNVTRLRYGEKEILLVGTAHVSKRSVEEVRRVIEAERPDTVCVELDETRYRNLVIGEAWKELDLASVIRDGKALFQLVSLLLSGFQRRIGKQIGVRPGAEMLEAIEAAKVVGAELVLADRSVQATLKRSARRLSPANKAKLFIALGAASLSSSKEITEEKIEQLKDRDTMNETMRLFAEEMPELKAPLIDERDGYLMSSIQEAPGRKIVAVVGAGHVDGMVKHLGATVDRALLSEIPAPSAFSRVRPWLVAALSIATVAFAGYRGGAAFALTAAATFALWSAAVTGAASVLAGSKVVTVCAAAAVAPLSVLFPPLDAGKLAGLLELRLRKPGPADGERLPEDLLTLRGMYANAFTRVLLVTAAVSTGCRIGGLLALVITIFRARQ